MCCISQERAQTIEAQLAETAKQLHDLKLRQGQLEARNHLLELAASNKRSGLPAFPAQAETQVQQ
jgi:regulator of replication initiation timing